MLAFFSVLEKCNALYLHIIDSCLIHSRTATEPGNAWLFMCCVSTSRVLSHKFHLFAIDIGLCIICSEMWPRFPFFIARIHSTLHFFSHFCCRFFFSLSSFIFYLLKKDILLFIQLTSFTTHTWLGLA